MHYHFVICWRLLSSLPPSVQFLQNLDIKTLPTSGTALLNNLRWRDRLCIKNFQQWVKVCHKVIHFLLLINTIDLVFNNYHLRV